MLGRDLPEGARERVSDRCNTRDQSSAGQEGAQNGPWSHHRRTCVDPTDQRSQCDGVLIRTKGGRLHEPELVADLEDEQHPRVLILQLNHLQQIQKQYSSVCRFRSSTEDRSARLTCFSSGV